MLIDFTELSAAKTYFTMTQTVIPRPIAWILTQNHGGDYNLAPFSYFNAVCSAPALLAFSIGLQDDGSEKDTLRNIRERGEMVVHIAATEQLPELNQSSATLPPGQSEVSELNLPMEKVEGFALPRLKDANIAFMCVRHDIIQLGRDKQQALVLAEARALYVRDECAEINEKNRLQIRADKIRPLSRLGASQYAAFGEVLTQRRPA